MKGFSSRLLRLQLAHKFLCPKHCLTNNGFYKIYYRKEEKKSKLSKEIENTIENAQIPLNSYKFIRILSRGYLSSH